MREAEQLERDQWERARGAWRLVLHAPPDPGRAHREVLRRVLRVKRGELPELLAGLPGVVRRGARRDLEPLLHALREAGWRAELVPAPGLE